MKSIAITCSLTLLAGSVALVGCSALDADSPVPEPRVVHAEPTVQVDELRFDLDTDAVDEALLALEAASPVSEVAVVDAPVVPPEPVAGRWFALRRGETLAHYARWAELPVEDIADASQLDLWGEYPVGTDVFVPGDVELLSAVETRREAHRTERVEGYLASRGGALGTDFVRVRSGDTAWDIARDQQGVPVWVIEAYNPSVDLDRLRPGQQLMVPVLADTVVDADSELVSE